MDELKKYLQENREALDTAQPSAGVWNKIRSRLQTLPVKHPEVRFYAGWMAAAAVLVIAATIFLIVGQGETIIPVTADRTTRQPAIRLPAAAGPQPETVTHAGDIHTDSGNLHRALVPDLRKPAVVRRKKNVLKQRKPVQSFEAGYALLVNEQLDQLRKLPVYINDPGYFSLFKQEFNNLEKEEVALKSRMKNEGVSNESLEGLVMVYQQKINILRNLRYEINRSNSRIREHTAEGDLKPTYIRL